MQPLAYAPAGGEPTDSANYFPKPPQASLQTALKDIEKLHSQTGDEVLLDDFISPSLSAGLAAEGPPRSVRNARPVNGLLAAQQTAGGSNAPQPTPPIGAYAALDAIQQPLAPGVDVIPVMSTAGPGPAMASTGQNAHEGGSGGTESTASDASVAKLQERLDRLLSILEQEQVGKKESVTEDLILYCFLGIFIIFVSDSFARAGKYVR